jgi:hypothetical protein
MAQHKHGAARPTGGLHKVNRQLVVRTSVTKSSLHPEDKTDAGAVDLLGYLTTAYGLCSKCY